MVQRNFHSAQVKRSVVIKNKLLYTGHLTNFQRTEDLRCPISYEN